MELDEKLLGPAPPDLAKRKDFEAALENYRPSDEARTVLNETTLVLLVGPSSSGRNTVITELLKTDRYHFIVSDTTRPPRVNNGVRETNGVEYWFRSEEDMLADIQKGEYLEAEVIFGQQVSGISIRELRKARDEQRIAVNDVDIGGIGNIMRAKPDTIALLLLPPSFDEWLHRLDNRGKMSKEEVRRRFETACRIFANGAESDHLTIVVNDTFERAVEQVRRIAEDGAIDTQEQLRGKALAERLLADTQSFLKSL